ncbi:MAG: fumarylacetoacetase [Planctomycetota bacterium]
MTTMTASPVLRALLSALIDYAGLFPPARLAMAEAIANYASYRRGQDAWMLGRFIVPATRLEELAGCATKVFAPEEEPVRLAVLLASGVTAEEGLETARNELELLGTFLARSGGRFLVEVLETRLPLVMAEAAEPARVSRYASQLGGMVAEAGVNPVPIFIESPATARWRATDRAAVAGLMNARADAAGGRVLAGEYGFKLRCGGERDTDIPSLERVAHAVTLCRDSGLRLKCTAGLHHALYDEGRAAVAGRHGFLNVFAGGALARRLHWDEPALVACLGDHEAKNFAIIGRGLRWRDHEVTTAELACARSELMVGFGSCSFDEPREDLHALGWRAGASAGEGARAVSHGLSRGGYPMNHDETTDPRLTSFVPVGPRSHFPIQNLPYGVFRPCAGGEPRVGVRIGDQVLDLALLSEAGLMEFPELPRQIFASDSLNRFLALGRPAWTAARSRISTLLRAENPRLRDDRELRARALLEVANVELLLPASIGDYTDFYSSREHATNVGMMFRGRENALMPNWLHLPVAYHGRSSSIVVSGTPVCRPRGQILPEGAARPIEAASEQLDFELEVGFLVGPGNDRGERIPVERAEDHIFGFVLVNDWSARDIQKWEYQPLGPFLAKNFATTISPWVVTLEALAPFRCAGPSQDPEPLPYLRSTGEWAFDIHLEVQLRSAAMAEPMTISRSNLRYLYWNVRQQLAHHTIGGCNLRPGDLLASGTISAPREDGYGCLLELTWKGTRPIPLADGSERCFLADGDTLTLAGWCEGAGYRVGFGECSGTVLPAS